MPKLKTLHDVFVESVRDIYSAEKQALRAMARMAKAAESDELRAAVTEHIEQTKGQVERLERVFEAVGAKPGRKKCHAMEGLILEAQELLAEDADPEVLDAGLIAAAQRVEHYEIAGYGCVRTYANHLGEKESAGLLQQTLDEEGETDKKLTQLAETLINVRAQEKV